MSVCVYITSHAYIVCSQWIFTQYEFLFFNVLAGKSAMFGTHPWHWYVGQLSNSLSMIFCCCVRYFSQGVPTMLFTLFPSFFIGGLTVTNHKAFYFISLYYIVVHRLVTIQQAITTQCLLIPYIVPCSTRSSDLFFLSSHLPAFMLVLLSLLIMSNVII